MKPPISSSELARLARILEIGLRSGRDWISILTWTAEFDHNIRLRKYLSDLVRRLRLDSIENILQDEKRRSNEILWRMFVEILLQAHRGSSHLSNLLKSFSQISYSVIHLERKERSLLFVPKFQSWASLLLTMAFTVGLPLLAPGLFPTFLTLGRRDMFLAGLSLILIGFILLHWLCAQPRRQLVPLLTTSFFFYFLAIFVESGVDLVTSWSRAVESTPFPQKFRTQLYRKNMTLESMEEFLMGLQKSLSAPWPEILTGLLWAKTTGTGLSQFLREVSTQETERLLFSWEDRIRKLTMISLIPLGLFVFPGTLFLLIGPQLMELLRNL